LITAHPKDLPLEFPEEGKMRGQISLEAIMVLGLTIIILTSLVSINLERLNTAREIGEAGEARIIGELLATAINNVYANGEGFSLYLSSATLNFTLLNSTTIEGLGVQLPLIVDTSSRTINITKNSSKTGMEVWNVSISIIPANITREDPTILYPQTTIRNNGSFVIIYANQTYIRVL
jgi:hypothetical protein